MSSSNEEISASFLRPCGLVTSREVGAVDVGLVSSAFEVEAGCEELCSSDLCGDMLRLVVLLWGEVLMPLMFGVLAIPWRQDNIRSDGWTCEAAEVLPSRRLRWLAFVAMETPAIEPARLEVPGLLLNNDDRSQSSPRLLAYAQSCRKTFIAPV